MQVIGFNFSKLSVERQFDFKRGPITTNIEFTNLERDKIDLIKDSDVFKIFFKYLVVYERKKEKDIKEDKMEKDNKIAEEKHVNSKQGEVSFEGHIILSVSKEESKDITKAWKKKQLPQNLNLSLFNLILRKCTPKAVFLEEEILLPIHTGVPSIQPQPQQQENQ